MSITPQEMAAAEWRAAVKTERQERIEEAIFELMVASADRGRILALSSDPSGRMAAMKRESEAFRELFRLVMP